MLTDVCTKQEVLDHFYLWVMSKYDWLGLEKIDALMTLADALLTDDLDYYADAGHKVLFNAITEWV